jgi:hypothetical protein
MVGCFHPDVHLPTFTRAGLLGSKPGQHLTHRIMNGIGKRTIKYEARSKTVRRHDLHQYHARHYA